MESSRRTFLSSLGLTTVTTLTGCQSLLSQDEDNSETPILTPEPTATTTPTPEQTETPTPEEEDTPTETPEPDTYQDSGTLYFTLEDENGEPIEIGPDNFFNQGTTQKEGKPHQHIHIPLTVQELEEKYQYNQLEKTIEADDSIEGPETLKELPYNILDQQWRIENIHKEHEGSDTREEVFEITNVKNRYNPIADELVEKHDLEGPEQLEEINELADFIEEKYTTEKNLKTRIEQSHFPNLWTQIAGITHGQVSSTNDYLKADAIAAIEYHATGNETATFAIPTNTGVHGLAFAITDPTYNQNKLDQQETWILETDTSESTQVQDLDEHEAYIIRDNQSIFTEIEDTAEQGRSAWEQLGLTQFMSEKITTQFHGGEEMEKFLKDPEKQMGKKYLHSACLAAHINQEANEEGALPEFEDAKIDVYPDRLEYQLN